MYGSWVQVVFHFSLIGQKGDRIVSSSINVIYLGLVLRIVLIVSVIDVHFDQLDICKVSLVDPVLQVSAAGNNPRDTMILFKVDQCRISLAQFRARSNEKLIVVRPLNIDRNLRTLVGKQAKRFDSFLIGVFSSLLDNRIPILMAGDQPDAFNWNLSSNSRNVRG